MARRENARERAIRAAISELIDDSPFQIRSITYPKWSFEALVSLNSSSDISVDLHARTSDARVYLEPPGPPRPPGWGLHSVPLSDIFDILGLGPVQISENEGVINKISEMIKLVKQNWSMIVSAFNNEDIINQLLEIRRKRADAYQEKTIRQIRNALMEFTIDGTFRIAQLDYYYEIFGNVILTLETDTNVSIRFVEDRSITECEQIVEGIPDNPENEMWLEAVFQAIGVDPCIRVPITTNIVEGIPIIMRAIKQHWPLIVQAFDDEHMSDTVQRVKEIKKDYGNKNIKRWRRTSEIWNALKEISAEGTFRIWSVRIDDMLLDNIESTIATDTNVDVLFVGDGKTVMCRLLVMENPDDADNELPLSYVLQAIGVDPSIIMLPSDVDFVDGVFTIMKAIKQHWTLIIQAFDDKHRADTIEKVKIIKTNHEEKNKTFQ